MNTIKPSRTPFQNDLLNDAGQVACLHEQAIPVDFMSFNTTEQHLTLDFMLTVPFMRNDVADFSISTTTKINETILSFWAPLYDGGDKGAGYLPWAVAAHFWAVYIKRETVVTFLPVKCYTPVKTRVDYVTTDSTVMDITARRNPTFEFDDAGCHPTSIRIGAMFPASYKISSLESPMNVPGYTNPVGKSTPNMPFQWCLDGTVQYSIQTQPQPGVVFPRSYNVFVFQSFTNCIISTITTPGQSYSTEVGELGLRNVFILPTSTLQSYAIL